MSGVKPPILENGPDNRSGVVILYIVIGSIVSVAITSLRLYLALQGGITLGADDILLFICLVFAIAQSTVTGLAAKSGLGEHVNTMDERGRDTVYLLIWVSGILMVVSLGVAKSSVIELHRRVSVYHSRKTALVLHVMVVAWVLFSSLTVALNCSLPRPWDFLPDKCVAVWAFYVTSLTTNILTDLIIVLHVIPGVWKMTMTKSLRSAIILLFCTRLFVCVPSLVRLGLSKTRKENIDDVTWDFTPFAILENVEVHISIITANIPRVHAFFRSLSSGKSAGRVANEERAMSISYVHDLTPTMLSTRSDAPMMTPARPLHPGVAHYRLQLVPPSQVRFQTRIYSEGRPKGSSRPGSGASPSDSFTGKVKHAFGRLAPARGSRESQSGDHLNTPSHPPSRHGSSDIMVDWELFRKESEGNEADRMAMDARWSALKDLGPDYVSPPKAPRPGYIKTVATRGYEEQKQ